MHTKVHANDLCSLILNGDLVTIEGPSSASITPTPTNLSGSLVDEGLDLSQRLSESMFTGPELDSSARDVVSSAGRRVKQATERALDLLDDAIRKVCYCEIVYCSFAGFCKPFRFSS